MKPSERGSNPHKYPVLDTVSPPQVHLSGRPLSGEEQKGYLCGTLANRKHGTSPARRCLSTPVGDLLQKKSMKNALIGCCTYVALGPLAKEEHDSTSTSNCTWQRSPFYISEIAPPNYTAVPCAPANLAFIGLPFIAFTFRVRKLLFELVQLLAWSVHQFMTCCFRTTSIDSCPVACVLCMQANRQLIQPVSVLGGLPTSL